MRRWIGRSLVSLALVGCGAGNAAHGGAVSPHPEIAAGRPGPTLSDDAFPGAVAAFLAAKPGSPERADKLASVVAKQMERGAARFQAHSPQRGLASVEGALSIVRTGELTAAALGPSGAASLKGAAQELAAQGDEGRARAVFELWSRVAKPEERAEIQGHLDALALWMKGAVASGGPVQSAGALESAAVARRLMEPSQEAVDDAAGRTIEWIDRALAMRASADKRQARPPREEISEMLRASQTAGIVLAAIYLRDADVKGALTAIEKAQARELVDPELMAAMEDVAAHADAERWMRVLHALRPREGEENAGTEPDAALIRASLFAAAFEAHRLDPAHIEAAAAVAAALEEFGMADAAPLVLVDAVKTHPDPRVVGGSLSITMRLMSREADSGDASGARRAFKSAAGLLAVADGPDMAGKISPTPARVRAMMGEIELREGRLDAARALLDDSLKQERSGSVLLELARIDRHDNRVKAALDDLRDALATKDALHDPALRGEILLETSDLSREQGDGAAARTPLTEALRALNKARNTPDSEDRARVERVLSRVLDRFGATDNAQRALDRAFDAAPRDKRQAAATVGQLVARAFVRGDLKAAREGLSRGLAADLDTEDIVYYALWVRLLERQLHVTTDGAADRVFRSAANESRWLGKLAAFGAGQLKPQDLVTLAQSPTEKTEALFYAAMDRRATGDAKGAESGLREVLGGAGIELMEVAITRDLLDGPRAKVAGPIPPEAAQP